MGQLPWSIDSGARQSHHLLMPTKPTKITGGFYAVMTRVPDDQRYLQVTFLQYPNVVSYGPDEETVLRNARTLLNSALAQDFSSDRPLPSATRPRRPPRTGKLVYVLLDPPLRMAYLLRIRREEAGITPAQMAKRMDMTTAQYRAWESPLRTTVGMLTLEKFARILGLGLYIDLLRPMHEIPPGAKRRGRKSR